MGTLITVDIVTHFVLYFNHNAKTDYIATV